LGNQASAPLKHLELRNPGLLAERWGAEKRGEGWGLFFGFGGDGGGGDDGGDVAEVEVEELLDAVVEFGAAEAVAAVVNGDEEGFDTGFFQGGVDFLALGVGNEGVLGAVGGEEGGVAGGDVGDGGGFGGDFGAVLDAAAEEEGFRVVGGFAVDGAFLSDHGEEVFRAEEVDDAGDLAGLVEVFAEGAFEGFDVATGAEVGDEVAAGGGAPDGDFSGVEVVFFGIGFDPADGGFAVVDLRGPLGFVGEAIADGDAGVVAAGEVGGEVVDAAGFVAAFPTAAVDEDDDGERGGGFGGFGEVEVEALTGVFGVGVGEVEFGVDVFGEAGCAGFAFWGGGLLGGGDEGGEEEDEEGLHGGGRNTRWGGESRDY
jgi:hypothetical protein